MNLQEKDRITYQEIKEVREQLLDEQGWICPLCEERIKRNEAVLDHDHETGRIRAAIHRGCNRAEGKCAYWLKTIKKGKALVFLRNLLVYWTADYSDLPIHPNHKR